MGVHPLRSEVRDEVHLQHGLFLSDPTRFLLVGPGVSVHEPWRERFQCGHLLLRATRAVDEQHALAVFAPSLCRRL
jgi:hypothetical protein